jgi:Mn2+/Fe2+ NRAMP family transporter
VDDDPSDIATYSIAGAQHGLALLWTALITWPLMAFVQMMCARTISSVVVVSVATLFMFGAAIAMLVFSEKRELISSRCPNLVPVAAKTQKPKRV